ncbi:MAG TPA: hypothetical protein VJK54_03865, partial [Chthoniobacterales bacterium]|nr:hypothetical protein [Chthoniobacterales bacterium]
EINRDGRDKRDKYREALINEKSFFEVLCHHLLFIKFQPIIPLEELALGGRSQNIGATTNCKLIFQLIGNY